MNLLMAPALIFMYVRLARLEDEELLMAFGDTFGGYAGRTPAFFPGGGSQAAATAKLQAPEEPLSEERS